jgi:peroxiredoxin
MSIKIGDTLNLGTIYLLDDNRVHSFMRMGDITENKRVVLFGGPCPFGRLDTEQAIEYAKVSKELMQYVNMVYGVYVQDAFVCKEFQNKIRKETDTDIIVMLADGDAFFVRNYRLEHDFTNQGLGVRSGRWSAVVNNSIVEYIAFDDFTCIDATHPKHILEFLKSKK